MRYKIFITAIHIGDDNEPVITDGACKDWAKTEVFIDAVSASKALSTFAHEISDGKWFV
jgi:hypothetical protein